MNEKKHRKPTPPSEAPGESGDREARREAEEAVVPGSRGGEPGNGSSPDPDPDAQRQAAEPREERRA
ncbi:hypothetical protein ACIBEA_43740 [Streptomyces sp. NPDC051555]|uniref:hypothetical protein n=1 Tax=Streptomyces sp. NPDC051555 TaxID=3365657 RepID=UPI0037A9A304